MSTGKHELLGRNVLVHQYGAPDHSHIAQVGVISFVWRVTTYGIAVEIEPLTEGIKDRRDDLVNIELVTGYDKLIALMSYYDTHVNELETKFYATLPVKPTLWWEP
jgi:hypothetical protein